MRQSTSDMPLLLPQRIPDAPCMEHDVVSHDTDATRASSWHTQGFALRNSYSKRITDLRRPPRAASTPSPRSQRPTTAQPFLAQTLHAAVRRTTQIADVLEGQECQTGGTRNLNDARTHRLRSEQGNAYERVRLAGKVSWHRHMRVLA